MTPNLDLLGRLIREGAEFVLVGGMAGVVHGSSLVTRDLDICAPPTAMNMSRVLAASWGLELRDGGNRDAPASDVRLWTDAGRLDVLWDIPGVGAWPDVK